MPLSRRHLAAGEEVVVEVHPHWTLWWRPLLVTALAGAVATALVVAFGPLPRWAVIAVVVLIGIPASRLGLEVLRWRAMTTVVTTERLMFQSGVIRRSHHQVSLRRVLEVDVHRSGVDRLVGRGDLVLVVDGAPPVRLSGVRHPRSLQQVILAEAAAWQGARPVERYDEDEEPLLTPRRVELFDDLDAGDHGQVGFGNEAQVEFHQVELFDGVEVPENTRTEDPEHGVGKAEPVATPYPMGWPPAALDPIDPTPPAGTPVVTDDKRRQLDALGAARRQGTMSSAQYAAARRALLGGETEEPFH